MIPYINIHTHHLPKEDGVFLFNNRFGTSTSSVTKGDEEVYTGEYFSVGIHPWDAALNNSTRELENLAIHHNCLAIGECGLDKLKGPDISIQKKVFAEQLQLALKLQKPVIIHCVKAFDELIEICGPYKAKIPLIIHGFNKSDQLAKQLIHKGFYLSLNNSLFKKNDFDFKTLPLENLFFETDMDDDLSISEVYQKASGVFNKTEGELKEKIYSNFTTLFK